ncbi:MAG: hypothetical protein AAB739_03705 [Patescibacteria group bacterium]
MKKRIEKKSDIRGQKSGMHKILKLINVVLVFLIIISLAVEVVMVTRVVTTPQVLAVLPGEEAPAQAEPTEPTANEKELEKKCVNELKNFMADKQVEFGEFINQNFRSEKPTSELLPKAIEKYRQYRAEVRGKAQELMKDSALGKLTADAAIKEAPACAKAVEEDFTIMKELLKQHVANNAYAKKSTRLLDQYKFLNSRLGELNFTIAQTYGYFAALSQKLPCYATTKCVK